MKQKKWKTPTWAELRKVLHKEQIAEYLAATPPRWRLAIALALSILKWRRGTPKRGWYDCALCELMGYHSIGVREVCRHCPLAVADNPCNDYGSLWGRWMIETDYLSKFAAADALYNKLVELYRAEYERA